MRSLRSFLLEETLLREGKFKAPEGYQEFPGPADAYRFVEEFEQEFK